MRILFITNLFPIKKNPYSGIFVVKRLQVLKEKGINFKVYTTKCCREDLFLRVAKIMFKRSVNPIPTIYGIEFHKIPCKITFFEKLIQKLREHTSMKRYLEYILKSVRKVAESLYNFDGIEYDIVHAHGMYGPLPAGLIAKKLSELSGIPYVVTLHGSDVNFEMPKKREIFLEVFENASAVIFVSNALKKRAMELGYSGKNAVVIPNGYDPEIFYPMDKERVRKELGIYKEGYKYVGFVGNLIEVKRADKLPEIFHLISRQIPNIMFIVVGDGHLRRKIEGEMRKRGLEVIFTGRVEQEEVAKWMNAMDVMILPSKNEGWPSVILEAQACETLVVGSSNGGIPEAIGFKEFVVREGRNFEKRLAKCISNILKNGYDRSKLIERAKHFTWENIVKEEMKIYTNF